MTATPKFIHLRVHTAYSILEGAIKMKELAKWAANSGVPAIAMTDTNNIFGAMDFADVCVKAGVQPILGCQLLIKTPKKETNSFVDDKETFDKVVVLVQNEAGYLSLLQFFKYFYTGEGKQGTPHLTFDELLAHSEGLILLTGGAQGILARSVYEGDLDFAQKLAMQLKDAYQDRLYIEIQRHGTEVEEKTEDGFLNRL